MGANGSLPAWVGDSASHNSVRAIHQLDLAKTFTVFPDTYLARMVVKVGGRVPEGTESRQQLVVSIYNYQDPAKLKGGSSRVAQRAWGSSTLRDGTPWRPIRSLRNARDRSGGVAPAPSASIQR